MHYIIHIRIGIVQYTTHGYMVAKIALDNNQYVWA
jgi:hypothetical protein